MKITNIIPTSHLISIPKIIITLGPNNNKQYKHPYFRQRLKKKKQQTTLVFFYFSVEERDGADSSCFDQSCLSDTGQVKGSAKWQAHACTPTRSQIITFCPRTFPPLICQAPPSCTDFIWLMSSAALQLADGRASLEAWRSFPQSIARRVPSQSPSPVPLGQRAARAPRSSQTKFAKAPPGMALGGATTISDDTSPQEGFGGVYVWGTFFSPASTGCILHSPHSLLVMSMFMFCVCCRASNYTPAQSQPPFAGLYCICDAHPLQIPPIYMYV